MGQWCFGADKELSCGEELAGKRDAVCGKRENERSGRARERGSGAGPDRARVTVGRWMREGVRQQWNGAEEGWAFHGSHGSFHHTTQQRRVAKLVQRPLCQIPQDGLASPQSRPVNPSLLRASHCQSPPASLDRWRHGGHYTDGPAVAEQECCTAMSLGRSARSIRACPYAKGNGEKARVPARTLGTASPSPVACS